MRTSASVVSCNQARKGVGGFTLVELLVVVAVIALVGALLLPVLANAQMKVRTNRCVTALKEIGVAGNMYAQDSDGKLVYASLSYNSPANGGNHALSFDDLLSHYLGLNLNPDQLRRNGLLENEMRSSWLCSADRLAITNAARLPPQSDERYAERRRTYAMPEHNLGATIIGGRSATAADWPPSAVNQTGVGIRLDGRIEAAGTNPGRVWNPDDAAGADEVPRFQMALRESMILQPERTIKFVERADPEQSSGRIERVALAGASGHTRGLESGDTYHNGRFNYMFVDGHVDTLVPELTYGRTNSSSLQHQSGMWTVLAGD